MSITNCIKFKGEIEHYLRNDQNNIDSKIDSAFASLKFKTCLCKTNMVLGDVVYKLYIPYFLRSTDMRGRVNFVDFREAGVNRPSEIRSPDSPERERWRAG